jgi:hypothetical protein
VMDDHASRVEAYENFMILVHTARSRSSRYLQLMKVPLTSAMNIHNTDDEK